MSKVTLAIVAFFSAYIAYVTHILYGFFVPKGALPGEPCYANYFATQDEIEPLDLRLHVVPSAQPTQKQLAGAAPEWEAKGFTYSRASMDVKDVQLNITIPSAVQDGKSLLYAHVFVTPAQGQRGAGRPEWTLHAATPLVRMLPAAPPSRKRNLLSEPPRPKLDQPPPSDRPRHPHWVPNAKVAMVWDFTCYGVRAVPGDIVRGFRFLEAQPGPRGAAQYLPALMFDVFGVRDDQVKGLPLNDTTAVMPLDLHLGPLSVGWWRLYANLEESLKTMEASLGADAKDTDDMRRMFTETSPVLLAVTMLVAVLHLMFEFLAFKNDVAFWRGKQDHTGVSARSVFFNVACQVVVLLYLIEEETGMMVTCSVVAGLLIEVWKSFRLVAMSRKRRPEGSEGEAGGGAGAGREEAAKASAAADAAAMNGLVALLLPACLGYAAYSLLQDLHASWYSWAVGSLYNVVFTMGFIVMTPQLFINYRLKSVEHMPWRTLIYRALNTFVDDLFAFIIPMPLMHRLSCFRDDIVFFVFLYQRWIYPSDKSRSGEEETPETKKDK